MKNFFVLETFAIYRKGMEFLLYKFSPEKGNYELIGTFDSCEKGSNVAVFCQKDCSMFTIVFHEERIIRRVEGNFVTISGDKVLFEKDNGKKYQISSSLKVEELEESQFTSYGMETEHEGFF